MPSASEDIAVVVGAFNPVEGKIVEAPTHPEVNEARVVPRHAVPSEKDVYTGDAITAAVSPSDVDGTEHEKDRHSEDVIIITGADAAHHLLPMRDDGDPAITFRGMVLATIFSGFQAVMFQIYQVSQLTAGVASMLVLEANQLYSSSQPMSPFPEHSLPSSPTSSAMPGPTSFPVATITRRVGGSMAGLESALGGLQHSPF